MSLVKEARCVFCTFARSSKASRVFNRSFSSAPRYLARNSGRSKDDLPTVDFKKIERVPEKDLQQNFTPEQQAAIKAANKVLKPEDLQRAGKDTRPWSIDYYDDLSHIDPVVDKPIKAPWKNTDENVRIKDDDELDQDLIDLMNKLPDDEMAAAQMWRQFDEKLRLTTGREEAERNPRSATAPDLPSFKQKTESKGRRPGKSSESENVPAVVQLMQTTGLTKKQIASLRVKPIIKHSVTNQTRLGKVRRMYVLSVAGDGNGMIGIGEGKAEEASDAMLQSQLRAIRNMQPILRYENRTIYGDVDAKVSATELELYARPPGFGLRCQQYIWEICRCAGITDLAARVVRSRNPMNTAKATVKALLSQKDPEDIARARGKKLVDVRKVYYANQI